MPTTERREVSRTKLEKLAYIHIEPDNGAIVLNVSGEGLGFHSMAPVERNGPLRFSLQEQNRRIDVCGDLVWTDKIQKVGGLRFTTLTPEAREQIHTWASQPAAATTEGNGSTLGSAFLRAFPTFSARRPVEKPDKVSPIALVAAMLKTRVRLKLSGFSGGVATGFLISALAALFFLFSYAHRRQFGESLIHLGERLASKPEAEHQAALPTQSAVKPVAMPSGNGPVLSASKTHATPLVPARQQSALHTPALAQEPVSAHEQATLRERTSARTQAPATQSAKVPSQPQANPSKTQDAKVKPASSNSAPPAPKVAATPPPVVATGDRAPARPSAQSTSSDATNRVLADTNPPATSRVFAPANYVRGLSDGGASAVQMFFDLGRFKQEALAQDLSDRVARLGLHTSVVQKAHLWMNSYQVLVGPYGSQDEEKKIHNDLLSHGYKARPFERGSRSFAFRSQVTLGGNRLPVGDFTISWESYVGDAKVKFAQGGGTVATADGKWVTRPMKYSQNEYVYENVRSGSRPLLEIHFSGQDRALVFREMP